jgi:hypothetical protein
MFAEGRDWFWWYGDDHSSDHDAEFDDLFRRHIRNAYTALGVPIPEELFATNISTAAVLDRLEPSGLLNVTLDGRDTSFLEWVGAASPSLSRPGGAMHEVAAASLVSDLRIGLSAQGLCFRLAGGRLGNLLAAGSATLALVISGPEVRVLQLERSWICGGSIVEIQVPFDRIGARSGTDLQFAIQIREQSGAILETVPQGRFWTVGIPDAGSSQSDWQV